MLLVFSYIFNFIHLWKETEDTYINFWKKWHQGWNDKWRRVSNPRNKRSKIIVITIKENISATRDSFFPRGAEKSSYVVLNHWNDSPIHANASFLWFFLFFVLSEMRLWNKKATRALLLVTNKKKSGEATGTG